MSSWDIGSKKSPVNNDSLYSTKTPDKPACLPGRSRNRDTVLSVKEVRRPAETRTRSKDPTVQIKSARRQILSWPSASSPPKPESSCERSDKLPEKFEILGEFFNGLDTAIRLLKLKRSMSTFTNIFPKIESLTDRRFSYSHLAQLKYIFPEVIQIKRVLKSDERTNCMKPDLHITLNVDAIEYDETKCGSKNIGLRKVFHARLADFVKAHPEGDEIPEEILPEPFNHSKVNFYPNITKAFSMFHNDSSSSALSEASSDEFIEIHEETSTDIIEERPLAVASHLSRSVHKNYRICSHEKTLSVSALSQTKLASPKPASTEKCPSYCDSPIATTPIKDFSVSSKEIPSTPVEDACTPARLMSATPALGPSKRSYMMSPDDNNSIVTPNKLVRHQPCPTRSLKFDTFEENEQTEHDVTFEENEQTEHDVREKVEDGIAEEGESSDDDNRKQVEDEINENVDNGFDEMNGTSDGDDDILDILPENLLQSIKEKERKAMEDRDPAISKAKGRRQMIACLPKLFNIIHFFFQSVRRTVITKDELLYKIISSHCDIVDRREAEEQLTLILELVPEWISERKASSGDLLVCINRMAATESIRARLEEATTQEISTVS